MPNKNNAGCNCCGCLKIRSGNQGLGGNVGWSGWTHYDDEDNEITFNHGFPSSDSVTLYPGEKIVYTGFDAGTYWWLKWAISAGTNAIAVLTTESGVTQTLSNGSISEWFNCDPECDPIDLSIWYSVPVVTVGQVEGHIRKCVDEYTTTLIQTWNLGTPGGDPDFPPPALPNPTIFNNTYSTSGDSGNITITNPSTTTNVTIRYVTAAGESPGKEDEDCRDCDPPQDACLPICGCSEKSYKWQINMDITGNLCQDYVDIPIGGGVFKRKTITIDMRPLDGTYVFTSSKADAEGNCTDMCYEFATYPSVPSVSWQITEQILPDGEFTVIDSGEYIFGEGSEFYSFAEDCEDDIFDMCITTWGKYIRFVKFQVPGDDTTKDIIFEPFGVHKYDLGGGGSVSCVSTTHEECMESTVTLGAGRVETSRNCCLLYVMTASRTPV